MDRLMKNNRNKIIIIAILTIILTLNFAYDFLGDRKQTFNDYDNQFVTDVTFENFQADSEDLVISKILEDKYNMNVTPFGLTIPNDTNSERIDNLYTKIQQYDENNSELKMIPYRSQVGLQGYISSFLYNKLHIPIGGLHLICSMLMGITAMALCYFLVKKYNKILGAIFYLVFIISPWVVAFAKNLYWVEFTWFLPAVFGLILSLNYSKKRIWVPLIGLAIFLKCLCRI